MFDFSVRSNLAQITNIKYFDTHEKILTKNPIVFTINNQNQRSVSGVEIALMRKSIQKSDFVVLEAFDENSLLLVKKEVNDYTIPNGFGEFYIPFGKNIKDSTIEVHISKKFGQNQILVQQSDTSVYEKSNDQNYGQYDSYYDTKPVNITFTQDQYKVNILGAYSFEDMILNVSHHFNQRPTFYYAYFTLTFVTLLGGGVFSGILLYKNRKLLNENA